MYRVDIYYPACDKERKKKGGEVRMMVAPTTYYLPRPPTPQLGRWLVLVVVLAGTINALPATMPPHQDFTKTNFNDGQHTCGDALCFSFFSIARHDYYFLGHPVSITRIAIQAGRMASFSLVAQPKRQWRRYQHSGGVIVVVVI